MFRAFFYIAYLFSGLSFSWAKHLLVFVPEVVFTEDSFFTRFMFEGLILPMNLTVYSTASLRTTPVWWSSSSCCPPLIQTGEFELGRASEPARYVSGELGGVTDVTIPCVFGFG